MQPHPQHCAFGQFDDATSARSRFARNASEFRSGPTQLDSFSRFLSGSPAG
jgi:hypothetical protein